MVNRFVLNTISYHGSGRHQGDSRRDHRRGFKKAFVCSDPDLVKFGVTSKVTDLLDEAGIPLEPLLRDQAQPHHQERAGRRRRLQGHPALT
jgi:alcohol dehydrogenase class IV